MKLVMTLLVRNEAEMIEANLDFHLAQGVDLVLVTDHGSTDDTRERLAPYERAGVVRVLESSERANWQGERVTRMARLALDEHGADWLFHNDADEFWWPLSGRLRDVFASIPNDYGQIVVPRRNFVPVVQAAEPAPPTAPFYERLVYREAESLNLIGAPLEPKVAHRAHPDAVLRQGNHALFGVALVPVPDLGLLEIFHFPMRTYEQFEQKVVQTGESYLDYGERKLDEGRDQMTLYERYRSGDLRSYWDETILDGAALERGLEDGSIVCDRRLATCMAALAGPGGVLAAPDSAGTRQFVTAALEAMRERDGNRTWLHAAQAELEATRARIAVQDEALAQVRGALDRTAASLDALQRSWLLRVTAPLRRLWYRSRGLG